MSTRDAPCFPEDRRSTGWLERVPDFQKITRW